MKYSIVIPAYNESSRLPATLEQVFAYLESCRCAYEVIVVNDGSLDNTQEVVEGLQPQYPHLRVVTFPLNRGKGAAVRAGVMDALGELVLFNDADGSTPIEELAKLAEAIERGADIAIGSRALYSTTTKVTTNWHRKFMGRIFNTIVNILILPKVADTQCGFKLFKKDLAKRIFAVQRADRFSFDVEVLFLARRFNARIAEIPVNWHNVPGSKVHLINDSLSMLKDIITFRIRSLKGEYRTGQGNND